MEIEFTDKALEDLEYWKTSGQVKIQKRITALLSSIIENPYSGIGKPEKLKFDLAGFLSRRITQEHRLVYQVIEDEKVVVVSLRYHYK